MKTNGLISQQIRAEPCQACKATSHFAPIQGHRGPSFSLSREPLESSTSSKAELLYKMQQSKQNIFNKTQHQEKLSMRNDTSTKDFAIHFKQDSKMY